MPILVALDDSEPAWAAFDYAVEQYGAEELLLVHVVTPGGRLRGTDQSVEAGREQAEQLFERAAERAYIAPANLETTVKVGKPVTELLSAASEHDASQIVIGSHGRSGVSRVLLGSVAESVARRAQIPVTVIR